MADNPNWRQEWQTKLPVEQVAAIYALLSSTALALVDPNNKRAISNLHTTLHITLEALGVTVNGKANSATNDNDRADRTQDT